MRQRQYLLYKNENNTISINTFPILMITQRSTKNIKFFYVLHTCMPNIISIPPKQITFFTSFFIIITRYVRVETIKIFYYYFITAWSQHDFFTMSCQVIKCFSTYLSLFILKIRKDSPTIIHFHVTNKH